jgi:hypothetical protein
MSAPFVAGAIMKKDMITQLRLRMHQRMAMVMMMVMVRKGICCSQKECSSSPCYV